MSVARLLVFASLCVLSVAWAAVVLLGQTVRLEHQDLLAAISSGTPLSKKAHLDEAIADYERALRAFPYSMPLHKDLLLLLAQKSDIAMTTSDMEQEDAALEKTQKALASLLFYSPMDGKAWLDFAVLNSYREGFTERSMEAYAMSATVAPGESWLAEKRLVFALKFRPLFDEKALAVAQRDLVVLERAHPNRMTAVMKAAQVESAEALYALFSAQVH